MEWIFTAGKWYVYLLLLGIVFFPISRLLFPKFIDQGYAFSKTLAIIILTYITFILGVAKIVPFTQVSVYIILMCFAFVNFALLMRDLQRRIVIKTSPVKSKKSKKRAEAPVPRWTINKRLLFICVFEEILFIISLLFLSYVRGMEPSARGLEKFMDFGFINSALRSTYFPPLDMWLSADPARPKGYPINYYYFGHLSGAYLIKLTDISPFAGYNLILATIFAQGITLTFSLVSSIVSIASVAFKTSLRTVKALFIGLVGTFIVNLGGNLHTIYLFTNGYPNESPVPFWQIFPDMKGIQRIGELWTRLYNPTKYWYPNATRFIPFTIHEFPSYSYVVADLHGHVFDIPFVLTSIAVLFSFYARYATGPVKEDTDRHLFQTPKKNLLNLPVISLPPRYYHYAIAVFLGFLAAVHYMTNAFDGGIYLLLALGVFFLVFRLKPAFAICAGLFIFSLVIFSLPFSLHFAPFASGIGVNCAPEFLVKLATPKTVTPEILPKIGPFLFESGKCQSTAWWMLFVLWGFFWVSLLLLFIITSVQRKITHFDRFIFLLFLFGTFLIIIPEFFYVKDIYPDHFRANTMFKLGYQAFMMMGVASAYTLYRIITVKHWGRYLLKLVYIFFLFFIVLYPFFAFPSYYGKLNKPTDSTVSSLSHYWNLGTEVELDGSQWLITAFPEDKEIIDYINTSIKGQPVILEAQGDSYTDYERISAYTGVPTVAGWWVHEWLWRGSADVVGKRIPDIVAIYESQDINQTRDLLKKYKVEYVVIAAQEKTKYPQLQEEKFESLGERIFQSTNKKGAIYQLNP